MSMYGPGFTVVSIPMHCILMYVLNYVMVSASDVYLLTDACCDDAQEQQDNGDVGLWRCARGHVVKKHGVVGPMNGGAVGKQWLIASPPQRKCMFLPLARHPSVLRGVGNVGHQQAKIHRAAGGKHGAHAQQQAAQVEAARDDACVNQAICLPESGEHHGAQQPRDGWNTHQ